MATKVLGVSWVQYSSAICCQPLSTKAGTPYYLAPQVTGWLRPGLGHLVKDQQKQIEQVKLHDDWHRWLVERHCTD